MLQVIYTCRFIELGDILKKYIKILTVLSSYISKTLQRFVTNVNIDTNLTYVYICTYVYATVITHVQMFEKIYE